MSVSASFQSLLHQGISLLRFSGWASANARTGFQSLLHQGISLLLQHGDRRGVQDAQRFNPFFIRASVYWSATGLHPECLAPRVSIPSSSGHQFTAEIRENGEEFVVFVSIPSSSGHQFTDIRILQDVWKILRRFNPFFIRASVYCVRMRHGTRHVDRSFQSLLHQGISLLRYNLDYKIHLREGFQSLLHQGISLLDR